MPVSMPQNKPRRGMLFETNSVDATKTTQANVAMKLQNLRNSKHASLIGKLSIPTAKIYLPIIKDYGPGSTYLALGACTMRPDQKYDKIIIHYPDTTCSKPSFPIA